MAGNEKIEVVAKGWDAFTTAERIVAVVLAGMAFAAGCWLGFWWGQQNVENRVTKIEAEKASAEIAWQEKVAGLQADLRDARGKPGFDISLDPPDDSLPDLHNAQFDRRTLRQYSDDVEAREKKRDFRKTTINSDPTHKKGVRFEWQGFVSDVYQASPERVVVRLMEHRFPNPTDGPVEAHQWCHFSNEKFGARLRELAVGDPLKLTGVMDENGGLYKCELR